ncbi:MAG: HNH endonuclease [Parabacteroides sp.]
MNKFIQTGKCIWCGRTEAETSFDSAPHVLPKALGGTEVGFDVCVDCNHYFGTAPKHSHGIPSIDHAFKEVFGAFKMFGKNLDSNSYKSYSSAYFQYRHKDGIIKIKRMLNTNAITRQFKRGLFEVFLQKYHLITGEGNNPIFDTVRKFTRYNIGDLKVYYAFNNVILAPGVEETKHPVLHVGKNAAEEIKKYGFFHFWLLGHNFFLEVSPIAANVYRQQYLQKMATNCLLPAKGDEAIFEITNINQIDIFMQRFQR